MQNLLRVLLLKRSKPTELQLFLTNAIFSISLYDQVTWTRNDLLKKKSSKTKRIQYEESLSSLTSDPHYKTYTICVNVNVYNENGIHVSFFDK